MRELRGVWGGFTRREFLLGAGGLLLVGAAGCGGASGGSTEGTTAGRRVIEHKYGGTEISGAPERVVTVGYTDHDPALALGVVPVAVRAWIGERAVWPWAEGELGGAEPEILPSGELNFEQIAGLEPDLILGAYSGLTREEYETLSEIAPTVAQSGEHPDYGAPWQDQTRTVGRALGREGRAKRLIEDVEARLEQARESHPEFRGATGVVAYSFAPGEYGAYGPKDARGRFLASLGLEMPERVRELAGEEFFTTISRERLDLLDADVLVWIISVEGRREAVEEDPLYRRLRVVSEGRDIFLEPDGPLAAALSFSTVLSLPYLIENLVPMLVAAVDGDPQTEVTKPQREER